MIEYLKKLDWQLIIFPFFLVFFGLLSIYSTSLPKNDFLNFKKQILFLIIGLLAMFFFSIMDWRTIRDNSFFIFLLYIFFTALLLGLFFFAPTIRGIKGWYKIGFFSIDPIEFIKILLLILLAKYFSTKHIEMYRLKHILFSGFYVFLPAVLVVYQPNLGSALILFFLWLGILIISGIKLRHFLALVLVALLFFVVGWFFILKEYQKQRIIGFLVPQIEPLGISWNQNQAKIAIGSGGIFGQGFNKGFQAKYGFLPEPQTDFIFAAIAEEYGFTGISVLFICFLIIIWRIIKIALQSSRNFPRLLASGVAIIIIVQFFINIGMNLGLAPVIGISLPFVSYGGSSLIVLFILIGILQSIKIRQ